MGGGEQRVCEKVGAAREGFFGGGVGAWGSDLGLGSTGGSEQSGGSVPGNVACYDGMSGMPEGHVSLREEG